MLARLKEIKCLLSVVVSLIALACIVIPAPAQAVKPGPYVPQKYDSVSTDSGKNSDDLVCTIENASKVHCELHAGNFSRTCSIQGAGECNRRDYYYNPIKSAQVGRDVFEADQNEGILDAEKDRLWGYVVFPLSKTQTGENAGDYSTFTITKNYRNFTGAEALSDTINGADEAIKQAGPSGICSVILNKTEPTECTIGGNNKSGTSTSIGKKISVAQQKDYTSGAGNFVNNKGEDCEEGGALGFILCPIQKLLDDGVTKISSIIVSMLNVPTSEFQDPQLKEIFNTVLIIANSLFALIFLIAIFANTLAVDKIDNYTIKKALPRLVIAVLLSQFAYYISIAVIETGNVLGAAIPQTLFSSLDASLNFNPSSVVNSLAGILFSIIFLLIALVAFLIGIFVLALRQIILIGIVLTGPVAFAAWVLPGTDKGFKFWWTNLVKLSLMYPIMSTLIVGSLKLSEIIQATNSANFAVKLGALALPIVAMLYLPKTFKWSGQLMSGTAGKISDFGTKKTKGLAKDSAKEGKIAEGINKGADKLMDTPFGKGLTRTPMLGTSIQKNLGARTKRIESKQNLENLPGARLEKMAAQGHKGAKEVVQKKYNEELATQEARASRGQDVDATKLVKLRKALGGSENAAQRETRRQTEASTFARAINTYTGKFGAGAPLPEISYKTGKAGDAKTTSTQQRLHYFQPPTAPGAAPANRVIAPAPPPNTPPATPLPYVAPVATQLPADPAAAAPEHDELP